MKKVVSFYTVILGGFTVNHTVILGRKMENYTVILR
jgi:hypothetical protein